MVEFTFTPVAAARMEEHGFTPSEMLGTIPSMIRPEDALGAVEQIDRAYKGIGGGWRDTRGFVLDEDSGTLTYPGDPARTLVAEASLRDERILFFNGAWIVVVQPDGSFRTARID